MTETSYAQLSNEYKELLNAAEQALENSHNPRNSKIKVAAAVRTDTGKIITGASYGNSSSPSNVCAEQSVIVTANNLGERNLQAIAIIGAKEGGVANPVTPCGKCRQVMSEVVNISLHDLIVVCSNDDKTKIFITSIQELLPLPYLG